MSRTHLMCRDILQTLRERRSRPVSHPILNFHQRWRAARCLKGRFIYHPPTDSFYCEECFHSNREFLSDTFQWCYKHLILLGRRMPGPEKCTMCNLPYETVTPIDNCPMCLELYPHYLMRAGRYQSSDIHNSNIVLKVEILRHTIRRAR